MNYPIPIQYSNQCNDEKRINCCSYCHGEDPYIENQQPKFTLPLDSIYTVDDETKPFSCIYLLNLFLAPDMNRYLQETSYSDDVFNLPIHLQSLICAAKMDTIISKENYSKQGTSFNKLLKLKHFVESVAHHDVASTINLLTELIHDEDELFSIVGQ